DPCPETLKRARPIDDHVDLAEVFLDVPYAAGVGGKPNRIAGRNLDRTAAGRGKGRTTAYEMSELLLHDRALPAPRRAFPDSHAIDAIGFVDAFAPNQARGRRVQRLLHGTKLIEILAAHLGDLWNQNDHPGLALC